MIAPLASAQRVASVPPIVGGVAFGVAFGLASITSIAGVVGLGCGGTPGSQAPGAQSPERGVNDVHFSAFIIQ